MRNLRNLFMQGVSKIAMSIAVTQIVEARKRELKRHYLETKTSLDK